MIAPRAGRRRSASRAGPLGRMVHLTLWAAALAAALGIGLWRPGESDGVFGRLEGLLLDARFVLRGPQPAPDGVVILAIDDFEITQHAQFPPPRAALADAIDAATRAGAASVALDLLLVGATEDDPRLADALKHNGRGVLAAASLTGSAIPSQNSTIAPILTDALSRSQYDVVLAPMDETGGIALSDMLLPASPLAAQATLGSVSVAVDQDGSLRRMPAALALFADQNRPLQLPGFALAALGRAADSSAELRLPRDGVGGQVSIGALSIPLDARGSLPLVHYGPSGTIPTWPLRDAKTADLAGKVVFIGATALGFGDVHGNPFDPALSGVEAHAALAANLLEGRVLRRDGVAWLMDLGACLVLAALAFWAGSRDRPRRAALACVGTAVVAAAALQGVFLLGWWSDAVSWIGALAVGAGAGNLLRMLRDRRRVENLSLFQSPALAKVLAQDGRPGFDGQKILCGTVFADLAGFTGFSERAGAEKAAQLMRAFQDSVAISADATGGVVTQFSGDGAMVVFGLLDGQDASPADEALRFLVMLFDSSADWPSPDLRAGAHLGPVMAGVMGGRDHRQVSVAGDAVNVASRLQVEAKARRAVLAVSDSMLQASSDRQAWIGRFGLHHIGPCQIRGRVDSLQIWTADRIPSHAAQGGAPP